MDLLNPLEKLSENGKENLSDSMRASLDELAGKVKDTGTADRLRAARTKADAVSQLNQLSQRIGNKEDLSVTDAEVNTVHKTIEQPVVFSTKPVEDIAQSALDKFRGMDSGKKEIVTGVGLSYLVYRVVKFFSNTRENLKNATNAVTGAVGASVKFVTNIVKTLVKMGLLFGAGIATSIGFQMFSKKEKPGEGTIA